MQYTRSTSIILAVVLTYAALAATSFGQDQKNREQRLAQAKKELPELTKELEFKAGTEVVALRDAELRVETKAVGTVRKGAKLTIEQVQDKWLWIRAGETRGWIENRNVISAKLLAWYKGLPNNESMKEKESGQTRAKFDGVLFAIDNPGSGPARMVNLSEHTPAMRMNKGEMAQAMNALRKLLSNPDSEQGTEAMDHFLRHAELKARANRVPTPRFVEAAYSKVRIFLERVGDRGRAFFLKFDPPEGATQSLPRPPGWSKGDQYGLVGLGDYVLIVTKTRQVFVNGESRSPR